MPSNNEANTAIAKCFNGSAVTIANEYIEEVKRWNLQFRLPNKNLNRKQTRKMAKPMSFDGIKYTAYIDFEKERPAKNA